MSTDAIPSLPDFEDKTLSRQKTKLVEAAELNEAQMRQGFVWQVIIMRPM